MNCSIPKPVTTRLLNLEASMGSKILKGTRQLTADHVRKLARHFALSADYFLEP
ncbi:MAG: hypothetical protein KDK99_19900 [Verrucomicrobiales bacterium]|nr:hypothetical protein [Verrucomicrobiales bacterium]